MSHLPGEGNPLAQLPSVKISPVTETVPPGVPEAEADFIRHGATVELVTPEGEAAFSKTVWDRGQRFPLPFYELRILIARAQAHQAAGELALAHS